MVFRFCVFFCLLTLHAPPADAVCFAFRVKIFDITKGSDADLQLQNILGSTGGRFATKSYSYVAETATSNINIQSKKFNTLAHLEREQADFVKFVKAKFAPLNRSIKFFSYSPEAHTCAQIPDYPSNPVAIDDFSDFEPVSSGTYTEQGPGQTPNVDVNTDVKVDIDLGHPQIELGPTHSPADDGSYAEQEIIANQFCHDAPDYDRARSFCMENQVWRYNIFTDKQEPWGTDIEKQYHTPGQTDKSFLIISCSYTTPKYNENISDPFVPSRITVTFCSKDYPVATYQASTFKEGLACGGYYTWNAKEYRLRTKHFCLIERLRYWRKFGTYEKHEGTAF